MCVLCACYLRVMFVLCACAMCMLCACYVRAICVPCACYVRACYVRAMCVRCVCATCVWHVCAITDQTASPRNSSWGHAGIISLSWEFLCRLVQRSCQMMVWGSIYRFFACWTHALPTTTRRLEKQNKLAFWQFPPPTGHSKIVKSYLPKSPLPARPPKNIQNVKQQLENRIKMTKRAPVD